MSSISDINNVGIIIATVIIVSAFCAAYGLMAATNSHFARIRGTNRGSFSGSMHGIYKT